MTQRCLTACLEALATGETRYDRHPLLQRKIIPYYSDPPSRRQDLGLPYRIGQLRQKTQRFCHSLTTSSGAEWEFLGFDLSAFLSLQLLPRVSGIGRWDLAAQEAARFLRLVSSASSPGRSPGAYLCLLAVPVVWALCFTVPDLTEPWCGPRTREQCLRHGLAVGDVFQALDCLADAPSSLHFAAGALAAAIGPPSARHWIAWAQEKARAHGARCFASFFDQVVTFG